MQAFIQRLRDVMDAQGALGEAPVVLTSGTLRPHLRSIVERFRPSTVVMAQGELHPRVRVRALASL